VLKQFLWSPSMCNPVIAPNSVIIGEVGPSHLQGCSYPTQQFFHPFLDTKLIEQISGLMISGWT
jgi:hypothetical protein